MSAVSEIMSPKMAVVLRIERTPTALDAVRLMIKSKVGSVVIVDMDGKPVGILTERDVLKKVTAVSKAPGEIPAQDIMSHPVLTIRPYDSIETAAAVMAKNKVKRLVVLEQDGSLRGVLSITDITRKLAKILAHDNKRFGKWRALIDF